MLELQKASQKQRSGNDERSLLVFALVQLTLPSVLSFTQSNKYTEVSFPSTLSCQEHADHQHCPYHCKQYLGKEHGMRLQAEY